MEHKERVSQIFDETFKRKVIEEYLSTGCSKLSLLNKYNIRFKSAIPTWMKKLGYTDPYGGMAVRFVTQANLPVANNNISKTSDSEELQKKIKTLEQQLEDERLLKEMYARMIIIAEQEHKISIRKKTNTR
jgi:hypothetical protein